MDSSLRAIDWYELLETLQKFATSSLAKDSLQQLSPYSSSEQAQLRMEQNFEAQRLLSKGERPFLESLDLVTPWLTHLKKATQLRTVELKDIRFFCLETMAARSVLEQFENIQFLTPLKKQICDLTDPLNKIDQLINETGEVRPDASDRLYQLEDEKRRQSKLVQKQLDRLVKKHQMEPLLQDRFVTTREGRWVLPVKSGKQHDFEGIIHAQSHSKQTVFMEPQTVIQINNRLREIEIEIEKEISRLLIEITTYLKNYISDFEITFSSLLEMDQLLAQAQLSLKLKATVPQFATEQNSENNLQPSFYLKDLKHPLLALSQESVIPNTVQMTNGKKILLLSGPNAGGKTVLLKSVGLAIHMARCGLPICCQLGSVLPFIKNLHISIGDSQSVSEALSTFAAHLTIIDKATQAHGLDQLLLIDEICGSTDPEEGTALARSFIEEFTQNNVYAVITSHLGGLKKGWNENSSVINGSMEYDQALGLPTYQLLMGVPGQSLAIKAAKRVGVQPHIVERAYSYLGEDYKQFHHNLEEIEGIKTQLLDQLKSVKQEKTALEKQLHELRQKNQTFEKVKAQELEKEVETLKKDVDQMISHAKVEQSFERHEKLQNIKYNLPKMIKMTPQSSRTLIESPSDFAKHYPPGSKVYISSLNRDGVVQGKPNSKGEVPVLSKSMRLVLPWNLLTPPEKFSNPTQSILSRQNYLKSSLPDKTPTLDVRGQRVEDVLILLEKEFDQYIIAECSRVKVIHGHGTDRLKRAIRSFLSRSIYVSHWSAGTDHNGGDGVTWVELNA